MNDESPEELALSFVSPNEREEVRTFADSAEAELAAGFLRAQGIAAEVGKMMMPGLQADLPLWVYRSAAPEARQLLDEADRAAGGPQPLE